MEGTKRYVPCFLKRFYRNRNFGNGDHGSCAWFMTQSIVSSFSISMHHLQLRDFGYNNSTGEIGNIPSGSNGSGIVPVTLSLMIGMTLIWISKLITFDSTCSKGGENKDWKGLQLNAVFLFVGGFVWWSICSIQHSICKENGQMDDTCFKINLPYELLVLWWHRLYKNFIRIP